MTSFSVDKARKVADAFLEYEEELDRESLRVGMMLRAACNEIDQLRAQLTTCQHARYTSSPDGHVRQCRDCFRTARIAEFGWDWGKP